MRLIVPSQAARITPRQGLGMVLVVVAVIVRSVPLAAEEPIKLAAETHWITPVFEPEGLRNAYDGELPAASMWEGGGDTTILCLAYSPDGKTLAVGDGPNRPTCSFLGDSPVNENGGLIRLVNTATRQVRATIKPTKRGRHEYDILKLAYTPDGQRLVTLDREIARDVSPSVDSKNVTVWDAASGRVLNRIHESSDDGWNLTSLAPDAVTFATITEKGHLHFWDTLTGREHVIPNVGVAKDGVFTFSPDNRTLALGDKAGNVTLWNASTARFLVRFAGHEKNGKRFETHFLTFSPDGRTLAFAGLLHDHKEGNLWKIAHEFRLFDVASRAERTTGASLVHEPLHRAEFSPDGTTLVATGPDPVRDDRYGLSLWDVAGGTRRSSFQPCPTGIIALACSRDGKLIAAAGDEWIFLHDAKTGRELALLRVDGQRTLKELAFSPDGKWLASLGDSLRIWNVAAALHPRPNAGHSGAVECLAYAPDGKTLASGSTDRTVKLWDLATRQPCVTLRGHREEVLSLAYSPDGLWLTSSGKDGLIKVWNPATGTEHFTLQGHRDPVRQMAFLSDGRTLISVGLAREKPVELKLWDVVTGLPKPLPDWKLDGVEFVAFSMDGRSMIGFLEGKKLRVWGIATTTVRATDFSLEEEPLSVAISPSGGTVAEMTTDESVSLSYLADGKVRSRSLFTSAGDLFHGGFDRTGKRLTFSRDGKLLAAAQYDAIRIWRIGANEPPGGRLSPSRDVNDLLFSPDGLSLAVGDSRGAITIWDTAKLLSTSTAVQPRPQIEP